MPIRRKAETPPADVPPPADMAPSDPPEELQMDETVDEEAAESAPPAEEVEGGLNGEGKDTDDGETEGRTGEKTEEQPEEEGGEDKKEEQEPGQEPGQKQKKQKRSVPAWATVSARQHRPAPGLYSHAKLHHILLDALQASKDRNGTSINAIMKYITNKYVMLDLDQRKFHLRKAMQRLVEKGMVKQLTGKGFSGSFAIGKLPPKTAIDRPVVAPGMQAETLGDTLPLIITRLCEPKEASYTLIRKYLEQHFPTLHLDRRPEVLKAALQRAVDKGHLEQITGKGASGTFQVRRFGDKELLKGGALEWGILTAITAMNEPKSCSTILLRKFLVETHKDSKAYVLVNNLKRTLNRCKMMGWMEQVTGTGLNGTYQLCYPYYPSPAILFPDKHVKGSAEDDSEEDDDDDDESEYEAPRNQRYSAQQRKRGRRLPPAKRPAAAARRAAPPHKKPRPAARRAAPPARTPKATSRASRAASRALPTHKTKTPQSEDEEPMSETETPLSKKARPTRRTKTPQSKKARPTRRTKTPESKKARPTRRTKTPESEDEESMSETETPQSKKAETKTPESKTTRPTHRTKTPESKKARPTRRTKTPQSEDEESMSETETPLSKTARPTRRTKTPESKKARPTRRTKTPESEDEESMSETETPQSKKAKTKTPGSKKAKTKTPEPKRATPKKSALTSGTRKSTRSSK
ncbi:heterochromatin protein 1-binding protein 3-like [Conger conger]|uniref:heterochromatin protein 1-binding protein 3-like n=1 Tax=Conger conger TaxID=82655 RepID=UPI002A5A9BD8|nr:heterochromatin protein 1-binding protein 3-like [Conger conger]